MANRKFENYVNSYEDLNKAYQKNSRGLTKQQWGAAHWKNHGSKNPNRLLIKPTTPQPGPTTPEEPDNPLADAQAQIQDLIDSQNKAREDRLDQQRQFDLDEAERKRNMNWGSRFNSALGSTVFGSNQGRNKKKSFLSPSWWGTNNG